MHSEEVAKEQSQILDELLIPGIAAGVSRLQVERDWDNFGDGRENLSKHLYQLLVV